MEGLCGFMSDCEIFILQFKTVQSHSNSLPTYQPQPLVTSGSDYAPWLTAVGGRRGVGVLWWFRPPHGVSLCLWLCLAAAFTVSCGHCAWAVGVQCRALPRHCHCTGTGTATALPVALVQWVYTVTGSFGGDPFRRINSRTFQGNSRTFRQIDRDISAKIDWRFSPR